MSGRTRTRVTANPQETVTQTVNEKILHECHSLYVDEDKGLITIAESLGLRLLPPRKKIIVLLIGNHSAGKSSFINWYIEEHVQKTGVAIETQGFTIVTSGRKRETLTGNATLHLYPYFKPLQAIPGVVDYLSTEVSTSKQKKFSLVIFIDTPGLVDGDVHYPYDVNEGIVWFGQHADLVFVFFDPIGQALCKRTMTLVEKLNFMHTERMRFYLSKADEAGAETDRQKVMMQIVQELCKRRGLNRAGFDMPTIYIPSPNKTSRCVNQIEEACKEIERTINQAIQNTLNNLEKDCLQIEQLAREELMRDSQSKSQNSQAFMKGAIFFFLASIMPTMLLLNTIALVMDKSLLLKIVDADSATSILQYFKLINSFWSVIPEGYSFYAASFIIGTTLVLLVIGRWASFQSPVLSRKRKNYLMEITSYIDNVVKKRKQTLYMEYLQQSVTDHYM